MWLGNQARRNPLKRRKNLQQGEAVLGAGAEAMPQYPLDDAFEASIPLELAPYWRGWKDLCARGKASLRAVGLGGVEKTTASLNGCYPAFALESRRSGHDNIADMAYIVIPAKAGIAAG
ncbi:MAG TPA: hypothetical protein VL094_02195 [Sphingomonadaceae bacterium]|nr:hypothetical protein [Sphingomonadaceae bacterium]